jgi:hypothetical protein
MIFKTARPFTISLPNPHSSECGSSRERQKPEASSRLINEKDKNA